MAKGKEEIGRIRNVVDPIGLLQQLGPQRVRAEPRLMHSTSVLMLLSCIRR